MVARSIRPTVRPAPGMPGCFAAWLNNFFSGNGSRSLRHLRLRGGKIQNIRNEFTAIVEQDGAWYVAYCAEVPGANGQGAPREECLKSLREAIALIPEHRREESLRALPPEGKQELVAVG
jgi:predicted RNase H-like HicB family nuclease